MGMKKLSRHLTREEKSQRKGWLAPVPPKNPSLIEPENLGLALPLALARFRPPHPLSDLFIGSARFTYLSWLDLWSRLPWERFLVEGMLETLSLI